MFLQKEKNGILTIDRFYKYYCKKYWETLVKGFYKQGKFVCAFKI